MVLFWKSSLVVLSFIIMREYIYAKLIINPIIDDGIRKKIEEHTQFQKKCIDHVILNNKAIVGAVRSISPASNKVPWVIRTNIFFLNLYFF